MSAGHIGRMIALAIVGAALTWLAAPRVEERLFPVFDRVRVIPFDGARPDILVERQLDRICFKIHLHKAKDVTTIWRSVVLVDPSGYRHFTEPLDGRTGIQYSNKDAAAHGFEGDYPICTWVPEDVNTDAGLTIENYGQYRPKHGLWTLDYAYPPIVLPPIEGAK